VKTGWCDEPGCRSPIEIVDMGPYWGLVWVHTDYTHYDHEAVAGGKRPW